VLRLLRDRRDQLSAARAQALNRLHRLFLGLVPGQALLATLQPWRATADSRPKLLGGGMSPTALTWAFASSVAKSSGYMLTSANGIMVSGHGHGFSVQKNMP
jgi:hypothetical protein